ncbi:MAG: KipI antagonist [Firmicutes bacterium]|nr:KipI antagonist [candidate division NPL-UPA2 bacterium]
MKTLLVLAGGLLTTVQDCGRQGLQAFGVPVSGAMDTYSLQWANKLVGNDRSLAALEMTIQGPLLRANARMLVALTGGKFAVTVNGSPAPQWEAIWLAPGDEMACGAAVRGARAYLAVAGGFGVPPVMGSRSTFLRGQIGGFAGRALRAGDSLPVGECEDRALLAGSFTPRSLLAPEPSAVNTVRVMLGPQDNLFTREAVLELEQGEYAVSAESDRMAYRLQGRPLLRQTKADIVSDGVAPGSIQVPLSGQPIVMLADRQTIGGYPKIATVIGADLPLLGQLRPGDKLKFMVVTYSHALALWREQAIRLEEPPSRVRSRRELKLKIAGEEFHVQAGEVAL